MSASKPLPAPSRRETLLALEGLGFRASSRLGQNFLFDPQLLEALLDDAGVGEGERILEVGAGAGTLTRHLLARGCEVVAVEIDPVLQAYLQTTLLHPRLRLVKGDALARKSELSPALVAALEEPYRLVANLPYAIATPLLYLALSGTPRAHGVGVLVQQELADRWTAAPGTRDYGPISVFLSLWGAGRITRQIASHLFTPPPRVESAFYVWEAAGQVPAEAIGVQNLCRELFGQRRKMLRKVLGPRIPETDPWWSRAGLDPRSRPEDVPPPAFLDLARELDRREGGAEGPPKEG